MYQQITLIGNLGKDPEMRYTPSGVPITDFSLAVSRSWTSQDGQRQEKTIWFRVTSWRKQAELVSQYLTKGSKVLVVGELDEPYAYIDKEGKPKASLQVTATNIRFLTPRGEGAQMGASASSNSGHAAEPGHEMHDEDIPF